MSQINALTPNSIMILTMTLLQYVIKTEFDQSAITCNNKRFVSGCQSIKKLLSNNSFFYIISLILC